MHGCLSSFWGSTSFECPSQSTVSLYLKLCMSSYLRTSDEMAWCCLLHFYKTEKKTWCVCTLDEELQLHCRKFVWTFLWCSPSPSCPSDISLTSGKVSVWCKLLVYIYVIWENLFCVSLIKDVNVLKTICIPVKLTSLPLTSINCFFYI